jgi:hypothetical protein
VKPQTVQDLHDAFVRCLSDIVPSNEECRTILRCQGWTPLSASRELGIHHGYFEGLINGRKVIKTIRRRIATLAAKAS